ncbi:MAG: DUF2470 domain-containing protein [Haloechinothrix sp.]
MAGARTRRPPAPHAAERAKSIAVRRGPATLVPSSGARDVDPVAVAPTLHHVHPDGSVSVLLDGDHPLVAAARSAPRGDLAVMCELADLAPVELREPTRGLLWITGWLRALNPSAARARALLIAETDPLGGLLDVGHGAALLCLYPASLVLSDGEGTHSIRPHIFAGAQPDPFSRWETRWLRHLECDHADVLELLAKHVPEKLRGGRIRPLGLDRFGLRLRIESEAGDHDLRLAFTRPASTEHHVAAELRRLVGCPFMTAAHPRE